MKVFLSGYGKMGRMLEELALERGWDIGRPCRHYLPRGL